MTNELVNSFVDLGEDVLDLNASSSLLDDLDWDYDYATSTAVPQHSAPEYNPTPVPNKSDYAPTPLLNSSFTSFSLGPGPIEKPRRDRNSLDTRLHFSNMSMDSTMSLSYVSDERCPRCDEIQQLLDLEQSKTQELEADVLNLGLHTNQIDQDSQLYQNQYIQLYDRFQVKCLQLITLRNMFEGKIEHQTPETLTDSINEDLDYVEIVDSGCKLISNYYSASLASDNDVQTEKKNSYEKHSLMITNLRKLISELIYYKSSIKAKSQKIAETNNAYKTQLSLVVEQNKSLKTKLKKVHSAAKTYQKRLSDTLGQNASLNQKLSKRDKLIEKLQNQLKESQESAESTRQELETLKAENIENIRPSYIYSTPIIGLTPHNTSKTLLSGQNPEYSKKPNYQSLSSIDRLSNIVKSTFTTIRDSEKLLKKLKLVQNYLENNINDTSDNSVDMDSMSEMPENIIDPEIDTILEESILDIEDTFIPPFEQNTQSENKDQHQHQHENYVDIHHENIIDPEIDTILEESILDIDIEDTFGQNFAEKIVRPEIETKITSENENDIENSEIDTISEESILDIDIEHTFDKTFAEKNDQPEKKMNNIVVDINTLSENIIDPENDTISEESILDIEDDDSDIIIDEREIPLIEDQGNPFALDDASILAVEDLGDTNPFLI